MRMTSNMNDATSTWVERACLTILEEDNDINVPVLVSHSLVNQFSYNTTHKPFHMNEFV